MPVPATRFLTALLLAALGTSCQQQPAETAAPSMPQPPVANPTTPTKAQRLSSIFSGYWVDAGYLDEVSRTRSPQKSFDRPLSGPASLAIPSFTSQQDSLQIGASYGMHEGGDLTLLLTANGPSNMLPLKPNYDDEAGTFRELTYRIVAGDTTLLLISRSRKTNRLRYQITYRRTGSRIVANDLGAAVERGVNKLLLARQYRGTDSLGQPVQAQFQPDGTVTGLPFQRYFVQTDFTGPNPGDELVFDVYTKQQRELAATFGRDSLKLYTIRSTIGLPPGGTDTTEIFTRGRLRYQFVRVR